MTEKEFHKMKPQDLVQLLLAQGIDSARLQESLEEKKVQLEQLRQVNDTLKERLNERDAATDQLKKDLDQSDARIRSLEAEMESLQADQWIDLKEIGTLTDAAHKLEQILTLAQQEADAYLSGEKPVELPKKKKNKKQGTNHLNSKGKDTDKENRSKGLEESFCVINNPETPSSAKAQPQEPQKESRESQEPKEPKESPELQKESRELQELKEPKEPQQSPPQELQKEAQEPQKGAQEPQKEAQEPQEPQKGAQEPQKGAQEPQEPQKGAQEDPDSSAPWPDGDSSALWPDEVQGGGGSGSDLVQEPWPDELPGKEGIPGSGSKAPDGTAEAGAAAAEALQAAEGQAPAAKPRKGLFGGLLQRKRSGKGASPKGDSLTRTSQEI